MNIKLLIVGGVGFVHVRSHDIPGTYELKNAWFFACFLLDFSIPPRSGGFRNTRFFFVVPSGRHWRKAAVFELGRCRARRDRSKRSMWATHPSLVVAALCSRPCLQFVRGWSSVSLMSYPPGTWILARTCPWTTLYSFFPFFSAGSSKKLLEYCLLLYFLLLRYISRFFLRQSVCARAASWLYYVKEAGQPTTYSKSCVFLCYWCINTHNAFKQGRDHSTPSSLRKYAEYAHNQTGSMHLLCRPPLLHLNIIPFILRSWIWTYFYLLHVWGLFYGLLRLIATYPPPKGNLVYL